FFVSGEHPEPVLYRKGHATFIKPKFQVSKLGFLLGEARFGVDVFRLRPGDVMICGSDGRDDLMLTGADAFHPEMNNDETLFLKHVEAGDGNLEKIYEQTGKAGTLTDDISLLRVEYVGVTESAPDDLKPETALELAVQGRALNREGKFAETAEILGAAGQQICQAGPRGERTDRAYETLLIQLLKACVRLDRFSEGRELAEPFVESNPGNVRVIYYLSVCCRMTGDLEYAADCGERVYLRDPRFGANLSNLIQTYVRMGTQGRARRLYAELLELEAEPS